jgi:hydrogenase-4 component F
LFHALNHSLVKAALFLLAGNILAAYGSKKEENVRALGARLPVTGALWVAGFFAITGAPPFGLFLSELAILRAAVSSGAWFVAAAYSLLLAVVFIGMAPVFVRMSFGAAGAKTAPRAGEPGRRLDVPSLVPLALLAGSATLGVWLPPALAGMLGRAVGLLGVGP